MQAYLFARQHSNGALLELFVTPRGHLSHSFFLDRSRNEGFFVEWNLCFMIFMLAHSSIIFLSLLSLDCFFFALWSPMWNFIISTWLFLFHLVLWILYFHPKWCPRGIWEERVEWYFLFYYLLQIKYGVKLNF